MLSAPRRFPLNDGNNSDEEEEDGGNTDDEDIRLEMVRSERC